MNFLQQEAIYELVLDKMIKERNIFIPYSFPSLNPYYYLYKAKLKEKSA